MKTLSTVESLEKEIDELESEKADFSNIYDLLLEECSSKQVTQQNLPQNRKQVEIHTNTLTPGMYRIATSTTQNREPQLPHAFRNTNPHVSTSTRVNHSTSVSRPQLKSYQVKDKVVPNNNQVKFTNKEVEDHHRISSISKKTKSVTACNDSSNSRTLNVNAVCVECGKCVFNSNHDACVSKYLNDINARTKKPKGKSQSVLSGKFEIKEPVPEWFSQKMSQHQWSLLKITLQAPFLNVQMTFEQRSSSLVLHQMTSDHNRSELGIQDHNNEQSSSKLVPKVVP
ncbi:hypothetical protein Tco_0285794 [Tanacetum coccineum]